MAGSSIATDISGRERDLRDRLTVSLETASKTERKIANFLLENLNDLPFETAASLAQRINVAEISIGRFCRSIGYSHFKELKSRLQTDMGNRAWLFGDRLRDFHERSLRDDTQISVALEKEFSAIMRNYEIAGSPEFTQAIKRFASCKSVWVVGFQSERGHAADLAYSMQYLRPGVQLYDLSNAHFAEILLDAEDTSLIIFEARSYSRLAKLLAQKAHVAGIPVTLITDHFCDWGRDVATEMLTVQTDLNHFWDATSTMSSLNGLIMNALFQELGAGVEDRMAKVSRLYADFVGHVDSLPNPKT